MSGTSRRRGAAALTVGGPAEAEARDDQADGEQRRRLFEQQNQPAQQQRHDRGEEAVAQHADALEKRADARADTAAGQLRRRQGGAEGGGRSRFTRDGLIT